MPECPETCGGPDAKLELLTESQLRIRRDHGCDRDISEGSRARYAIKCPVCDGLRVVGVGRIECTYCEKEGMFRGFVPIRRCPASHYSPDLTRALNALVFMRCEGGAPPEPGGMLDQSPTFLQFLNVFNAESTMIQREQRNS